jgi:tellurite resistance protein
MRRSTLLAAFAALLAAGLWHLPATAQRTPAARPESQPATAASMPTATAAPAAQQPTGRSPPAKITFAEYRDFRLHFVADRRARLAQQLASPGLSADEKARLERTKAYYDGLAAMPAAERDRLYHARFDQIDTDHDGTIDDAERAAWRVKQRQYYAEVAAERAAATADQH